MLSPNALGSQVLDKVLSNEDLAYLWDLYCNSTNRVVINGIERCRHQPSNIGSFNTPNGRAMSIPTVPMVSSFSNEEAAPIWDKIKTRLNNILDKVNFDLFNFELERTRILTYIAGSVLPAHVDQIEENSRANYSLIVPINHPREYEGGFIIIDSLKLPGKTGQFASDYRQLKPGDGVTWDYHTVHEVSKIKRGTRYVANFRIIVSEK